MFTKDKILVAQGGGPTMVINKSLIGIINESKKKKIEILGALNGVNGIINNKIISFSKFSKRDLLLISNQPGSFLGSTRDKPDKKYCLEILKVLTKRKISKFFYIGGNDSSDSLKIISEQALKINYNLQCIHVPKTIDNDLVLNDHTPGFGSAAKYVANFFSGINLDIKSLPGVYIGIVMGRHAGFLTASSSLLRRKKSDGPHLIYLPENNFIFKKFFEDVKKVYTKYERCIIAISEGIKNEKGQLIAEKLNKKNEKDDHGNVQLSGSGSLGDYLANEIKAVLKLKRVRADTLGYAQRSFPGFESEVDQNEAYEVGKKALIFSLKKKGSFSVGIVDRESKTSKYKPIIGINKLDLIAGKTKYMPKKFINPKKNNITNSFIKYARPLIGEKNFLKK